MFDDSCNVIMGSRKNSNSSPLSSGLNSKKIAAPLMPDRTFFFYPFLLLLEVADKFSN